MMMESAPVFSVYDWLVFSCVMVVSASLGIYHGFIGSRQKTTAEYLLADRSMGFLPVAMSLLGTFYTGIVIQGVTADVYYRTGCLGIWWALSGVVTVWIGARCFLPIYYRFQFISIYEYLELRFNPFTRNLGLVVCYFFFIMHSGVTTFGGSLALSSVSNLDLNASIFILSAVCIFYTVLGGMKAILWADFFQMTLCIGALVSVIIKVSLEAGGMSHVLDIARKGERTQVFEFSLEASEYMTFWNSAVFGVILWMPSQCTFQHQVQRMLSCKDFKTTNNALLVYGIGLFVIQILIILAGLCLYAYYEHCDPYSSGQLELTDGILPYFLVDAFNHLPGIPGLLVSGLCCLALSTVSSVLSGLSAITGKHIIKSIWPNMSENIFTISSKALVLAFGIIILGVTFLMPKLGSLIATTLGILGVANGPILGVFCMGIFIPQVNTKGALAGFFAATVVGIWIITGSILNPTPIETLPLSTDGCIASNVTSTPVTFEFSTIAATTASVSDGISIVDFYALSRLWYTPLNFGISVTVGVIVSFITGFNDPKSVDPRLICNLRQSCLFQLSMDDVDAKDDKYETVQNQDESTFCVEEREIGKLTVES